MTTRHAEIDMTTGLPAEGKTVLDRAGDPSIDNRPPEVLPPEDRVRVKRAAERASRDEFATDAEIDAAFRQFGP